VLALAVARAGTLTITKSSTTTLTYVAAAGETNKVTVQGFWGFDDGHAYLFRVTDTGAIARYRGT
jgi:hypothetical protein